LNLVRDLPIDIDPVPDEAATFALARNHRLTFYDAVYLGLAQRRGLPIATLDSAIARAARVERIPLVGDG
jgi:predicted nucleic acid-binding protein